jgi:hypothetical protein
MKPGISLTLPAELFGNFTPKPGKWYEIKAVVQWSGGGEVYIADAAAIEKKDK